MTAQNRDPFADLAAARSPNPRRARRSVANNLTINSHAAAAQRIANKIDQSNDDNHNKSGVRKSLIMKSVDFQGQDDGFGSFDDPFTAATATAAAPRRQRSASTERRRPRRSGSTERRQRSGSKERTATTRSRSKERSTGTRSSSKERTSTRGSSKERTPGTRSSSKERPARRSSSKERSAYKRRESVTSTATASTVETTGSASDANISSPTTTASSSSASARLPAWKIREMYRQNSQKRFSLSNHLNKSANNISMTIGGSNDDNKSVGVRSVPAMTIKTPATPNKNLSGLSASSHAGRSRPRRTSSGGSACSISKSAHAATTPKRRSIIDDGGDGNVPSMFASAFGGGISSPTGRRASKGQKDLIRSTGSPSGSPSTSAAARKAFLGLKDQAAKMQDVGDGTSVSSSRSRRALKGMRNQITKPPHLDNNDATRTADTPATPSRRARPMSRGRTRLEGSISEQQQQDQNLNASSDSLSTSRRDRAASRGRGRVTRSNSDGTAPTERRAGRSVSRHCRSNSDAGGRRQPRASSRDRKTSQVADQKETTPAATTTISKEETPATPTDEESKPASREEQRANLRRRMTNREGARSNMRSRSKSVNARARRLARDNAETSQQQQQQQKEETKKEEISTPAKEETKKEKSKKQETTDDVLAAMASANPQKTEVRSKKVSYGERVRGAAANAPRRVTSAQSSSSKKGDVPAATPEKQSQRRASAWELRERQKQQRPRRPIEFNKRASVPAKMHMGMNKTLGETDALPPAFKHMIKVKKPIGSSASSSSSRSGSNGRPRRRYTMTHADQAMRHNESSIRRGNILDSLGAFVDDIDDNNNNKKNSPTPSSKRGGGAQAKLKVGEDGRRKLVIELGSASDLQKIMAMKRK